MTHGSAGGSTSTPAQQAAPARPAGPGGIDTDAIRRSWPDVLEWLSRHKRVTWTFVAQNAQVLDYDGQRVLLGISTVGLVETFRRGAHADYVRQALIDVLGVDARIDGQASDAVKPSQGEPVEPAPARADGSAGGPPQPESPPAPVPTPAAPADDAPRSPASGPPPSAPAPASTPRAPVPPTREPASWSDAPPPVESAPSWASPFERAKAVVAEEVEQPAVEHVVDDTAISDDDESIDDLADVGVPVVERILGGTVISEEPR